MYGDPHVLSYCSQFFSFLSYNKCPVKAYRPFTLFGMQITLLPVNHPPVPTFGLRIETKEAVIGYTADSRSDIPYETRTCLEGVDLLLIDGMVPPDMHLNKHMNYEEACCLAEDLGVRSFRCVHLSHLMPWELPCLAMDMDTWNW